MISLLFIIKRYEKGLRAQEGARYFDLEAVPVAIKLKKKRSSSISNIHIMAHYMRSLYVPVFLKIVLLWQLAHLIHVMVQDGSFWLREKLSNNVIQ